MKLLLDHNLSPKLVNLLRDLCPDIEHVFELGLADQPDDAIWQYARAHGQIIVTKDSDYDALATLRGAPPKVIWVQAGNCSTRTTAQLLRRAWQDIVALDASEQGRVLEVA
jgi:predicted nuclease of predicted toxin-antitoxin system